MDCPFCGGTLTVHNSHWVDPFFTCPCQTHMFRKSEVLAHMPEEETDDTD